MRRLIAGATCALIASLAPATTALAHQGNPNYRSIINGVTPQVQGVSLDILNFDDRIELTNRSSEPIVVDGYNREPYVRILADGTVQVNRLSPATYLNVDRTGEASTPAFADAKAAPQWKTIDKTGHYEWHDHRIHWMSKGLPQQVKDTKVRTKIYDWSLPVQIGDRKGAIAGTLFWQPRDDSGMPVWAIALLAVVIAGGGAAMVRIRRRRDEEADGETPGDAKAEAW